MSESELVIRRVPGTDLYGLWVPVTMIGEIKIVEGKKGLFRTLTYRRSFPSRPFADLAAAQQWVDRFVRRPT